MMSDSEEFDVEVSRILDRIAKRLSKGEYRRKKYFKTITSSSPHGVYIYDKREEKWLYSEEDRANIFSNGYYVVYFDNTECSACRKYDKIWFPIVENYSNKFPYTFIIILCGWFSNECKSKKAASFFDEFKIKASPTTLFLYVKNGKIVYDERYEGVLEYKDLIYVLKTFEDRALRAEKGLPVIKPPMEASQVNKVLKTLLSLLSLNVKEE